MDKKENKNVNNSDRGKNFFIEINFLISTKLVKNQSSNNSRIINYITLYQQLTESLYLH